MMKWDNPLNCARLDGLRQLSARREDLRRVEMTRISE